MVALGGSTPSGSMMPLNTQKLPRVLEAAAFNVADISLLLVMQARHGRGHASRHVQKSHGRPLLYLLAHAPRYRCASRVVHGMWPTTLAPHVYPFYSSPHSRACHRTPLPPPLRPPSSRSFPFPSPIRPPASQTASVASALECSMTQKSGGRTAPLPSTRCVPAQPLSETTTISVGRSSAPHLHLCHFPAPLHPCKTAPLRQARGVRSSSRAAGAPSLPAACLGLLRLLGLVLLVLLGGGRRGVR